MFSRQNLAALLSETLGVAILASAMLSMLGRSTLPFFSAVAAAVGLTLVVFVGGNRYGTYLNPAVTIGQWTLRKIDSLMTVALIGAQLLGGVIAWQLNQYLLNQPLRNSAGETFEWRVLIAEAIGGFLLGMVIMAVISKRLDTDKQSLAVSAGYMVSILIASLASNGMVNPAVAIGIQSWSWAYVLGPIAGTLIGMTIYGLIFSPLDNPNTTAKLKTGLKRVAKKSLRAKSRRSRK